MGFLKLAFLEENMTYTHGDAIARDSTMRGMWFFHVEFDTHFHVHILDGMMFSRSTYQLQHIFPRQISRRLSPLFFFCLWPPPKSCFFVLLCFELDYALFCEAYTLYNIS